MRGDTLRRGPLELHPERQRASWRGREVDLTLREYAIVEKLATLPGQDLQYRRLYYVVRGSGFSAGVGTEGYQVNVRAFIKRIRRKFRDIDPEFDAIENYPRFGYRWRPVRKRDNAR